MPLFSDRVAVTTVTTGTGNLALGPAVASYRSFTLGFADGPIYYGIIDEATGDWEIGLGTLSGGGTTLARTTVYSSTNANALVSFAAGTKIVYGPVPAYAINNRGMPDGTPASPGWHYEADVDTGFYRTVANTIGFSTGGVSRALLSTTELTSSVTVKFNKPADFWDTLVATNTFSYYEVGAAAAPTGSLTSQGSSSVDLTSNGYRNTSTLWTSYAFSGNLGAAQVRLHPSGYIAFRAEDNKPTGSGPDVTEIARVQNGQFLTVDGTVTAPSYTWLSDPNTGIYSSGSNQIAFAANGIQQLRLETGAFVARNSGQFAKPADFWSVGSGFYQIGSATTPMGQVSTEGADSIQLTSNGYRSNAGTWISYAVSGNTGATQLEASPTGIIVFRAEKVKATGSSSGITEIARIEDKQILLADAGTAALPSYSWLNDRNTGMFSPALDVIGWAIGSKDRMRLDADALMLNTLSISGVNQPGFILGGLSGAASSAVYGCFSANATASATLHLARSRGVAYGSYTIVANGDYLGQIRFMGSDGTTTVTAASIYALVDGAPAAGSIPSGISINTTPVGSAVPVERLKVTAAGDVGIGTSTPSTKLHVSGPIRKASYTVATLPSAATVGAGTQVYVSDVATGPDVAESDGTTWFYLRSGSLFADGAVGTPSITFALDTDTGFWRPGANSIGVSSNGVEVARFGTTGLLLGGATTMPSGAGTSPLAIGGTTTATASQSTSRFSADTEGAIFNLNKTRGVTTADYAMVATDDVLGRIRFRGGDGVTTQMAAAIQSQVEGIPAAGDIGARILFLTRPTGGGGLAERMRVASTGDVSIGGITPTTKLHVNGPVRVGSYTKATLPAAATVGAGTMAWCTDATGGSALVTSNGTGWTLAGTQTAP